MAKSQITEDDITQGIQTLGGFGNLAQKPRRDSPFGSDFAAKKVEPKLPAPTVSAPAPEPVRPPITAQAAVPTQPLAKRVEVVVPLREEAPQIQRTLAPKIAAPKKEVSIETENEREGHPKSETLTERITLQMSPEMRDSVNEIARQLQRTKREKGERITANTVMRVAIQSLIDSFDPKSIRGVSSEEELFQEMKVVRKIKG